MLIPKKNRIEIYKYLFREGVLYAEKDFNLPKHPSIDVPNLQVIKLMQSLKSKEFVTEQFAWRHYYWFLTNEGIEHLREYLNLPSEIVPNTLKKSTRNMERRPMGDRPPRRDRGERDGYRGAPGGYGRGAAMDKGSAPGDFQPGFGRGGAPPAPQ
ncbi:plectin/S10 domain-containing protein [Chloropicon primus]|uniref:Plectin/S10 domain-containing protein n=1 Tax=Chloropicon primus TaxID=1764295 RepID=A0A5B8MBZ8_9CHLO|nr:plectin/S10 domain-containing protein [Chloropicon primus]UPQ97181.1 plectin/S10 domain-containing protein [Chloropicon primus]|mmetsp:Transcript_9590/g.27362  ORF Transcript_9590/g.27362 Transcript_9590/m.27362 type:complete len:155 (+) Transcript_9590:163-627(+)|eukprot:QDZ17966.1 plectin/S10 domain-containing protein [Chloropicon primus]